MDVFENGGHNHTDPFEESVHDWLSKNFMPVSMVTLSILWVLVFSLFLFIRCVPQAAPTRHRANTMNRFSVILLHDHTTSNTGLDPALVAALPLFVVEPKVRKVRDGGVMECAVCLSDVEDEEVAKLLPNCEHYFHVDCIDMWLTSHSTCPLCRARVGPRLEPQVREGPRTLALGAPSVVLLPVLGTQN